jgi:hypothetical protein
MIQRHRIPQNLEAHMADILPNSLIGKSEKGKIAIRDRDRSLQPRARSLLIMIDGSKTAQQLAAMNPDPAQGMELVNSLVADGFAEVLGTGVASVLRPPTASVATPAAPPTIPPAATAAATPVLPAQPMAPAAVQKDLKLVCRAAIKYLESIMGPGAEAFALQLEKCKTVAEFDAKAQEIRRLLAATHSEKRGADFAAAAMLR